MKKRVVLQKLATDLLDGSVAVSETSIAALNGKSAWLNYVTQFSSPMPYLRKLYATDTNGIHMPKWQLLLALKEVAAMATRSPARVTDCTQVAVLPARGWSDATPGQIAVFVEIPMRAADGTLSVLRFGGIFEMDFTKWPSFKCKNNCKSFCKLCASSKIMFTEAVGMLIQQLGPAAHLLGRPLLSYGDNQAATSAFVAGGCPSELCNFLAAAARAHAMEFNIIPWYEWIQTVTNRESVEGSREAEGNWRKWFRKFNITRKIDFPFWLRSEEDFRQFTVDKCGYSPSWSVEECDKLSWDFPNCKSGHPYM